MSVLIFANGELGQSDWVHPFLEHASVVIAADGGARHVLGLGRAPDVVIGDLDSLPTTVQARLQRQDTLFLRTSTEKDETDLELALLYAVKNYGEPIRVFAGLGGRLDQMFANILLLIHPQLRGREICFQTRFQLIWLVDGYSEIAGARGDTVSLIALGGDALIRSTSGLKWSLRDEILKFGPARGVSNEMTGEQASVTVAEGHVLCIHTSKLWKR